MPENRSCCSPLPAGTELLSPVEKPVYPKVSIVIVSYNSLNHLVRCFPSVIHLDYPDFEVILVDNHPSDGSAAWVKQHFPDVHVVNNPDNTGYAGGNNLGFAMANGEYVAVLNPDSLVEPGWLRSMVQALEADPRAGLAAGKILLMDDPSHINTCGLDITFTGLSFCRGLGQPSGRYQHPEVVFGVSGCAFVCRRQLLEELGGFDGLFFTYYEDTDLSLRANLAGYRCLYVPSAISYHQYVWKFSASKCYYQERNRYIALLKSLRVPTLVLLSPMLILSEVIAWGYALLQGPEHLKSKYRSLTWLAANWRQVSEARRKVQLQRQVPDRVLLSRFSWRLSFANTAKPLFAALLSASLNPLVFLWGSACRAVVFW